MWDDFSFADIVGLVGSLLICGAYWAVSTRRTDPAGMRYQIPNLLGAAMVLVSLYFRPNLGAIVVEAVWLVVAAAAICRALLKRT